MIINPGQPNPYDLDLSKEKILIVDDFVDMRSMMKRTVESFKASQVEVTKNGEEALERMAAIKFDLVLCDYNLGDGKDGQQILEEAKFRKYVSSTTIWMMITAETTVEMVMGALEYKPDDYVTKPFTKQEFAIRVMKIQARKKELKNILVARDQGDFEQALSAVSARLAEKETFELLQIKADLHERLQAWREADAVYSKVLGTRPIAWAQLGHARMLIKNNEFDAARDTLTTAIAQTPSMVEAYDLLASVHEKLGDMKKAQQVLENAVEQSPKAILRQKALARIAYANGALDVAEKAHRRIIKMGRGSVYKTIDDYSSLARIYVDKGETSDALKALASIKEQFKHDQEALLQGFLAECTIYNQLGMEDQAKQALDEATALAKKAKQIANPTALELIGNALKAQRADLADHLTLTLVRNNHDNETLLTDVQEIFTNDGDPKAAEQLIAQTKKETAELLGEGAQLVKQGELDAAVEHFLKIASDMPNNIQVNLGIAQTLVKAMQQNSKNERYRYLLRQRLDKLNRLAPQHELLPTLNDLYRQLAA